MKPYAFTFRSIVVSWFMLLFIISILISYIYIRLTAKKQDLEVSKVEDVFFTLLLSGFLGARLTYVILHLDYYNKLISIFKISHMNLSLIGGILTGLLVIYLASKKKKISFDKLFKIFVLPFYISSAIIIWSRFFEGFLIGKKYNGFLAIKHFGENRHPVVLYISLWFILAAIIESMDFKNLKILKNKNISYVIFAITILGYYGIKYLYA